MKQLSSLSVCRLKTILLPQGHAELMVLIVSFIYYGFIFLFYLQNRLESVLPEMLGYDTSVHMVLEHKLINLDHIFSWNIRHPLINFMFLPPIIGDYILSYVGYYYKWEIFTFYSCIISSYSGLLLYKVISVYSNNKIAFLFVSLFFSFAHSILLSIQIDSFVLSLFFLIILVLIFSKNYYNIVFNNILFLGITGTTSTNFVKFLFYIYLTCKRNIKVTIHHIILSSILFFLLLLLTIPDLFHRIFVQHLGVKYSLLAQTLDYRGSSQSKIRLVIDNFISEPLLFHHQEKLLYISETSQLQPYPSASYYIPIIIIICGVILSIITNINNKITKLFILFICIDFFIHVTLGYGVSEGQIFCAHWFFIIPILLALLDGCIKNKQCLLLYRFSILVITIFFFYNNLNCYIHGF